LARNWSKGLSTPSPELKGFVNRFLQFIIPLAKSSGGDGSDRKDIQKACVELIEYDEKNIQAKSLLLDYHPQLL
jgi:hypothetical protein